ncbi:Ldh family oxidoreductase [Rhodococcoides kyotonense]|uniref:Malate/lactate/ureidoglycolate dehydrogenase, LDH2 family n=1 Tax=Rhodococcoides kyotonense TaxID=398843 RepID=A0A239MYW5_9NOCA|nr:Ldh family oxidoreductase [Rhodococcus kyotonensis]SNT47372.1 Malate/lactate/ureidoglycolate dehydrogenase, LDH2 family [Rhodococcus kyotonensis]
MTHATRIKPDALTDFATTVLRSHNVPEADAHLVADSLVQSDLWGHQSHGVLRLPWYVARLRTGVMTAVTEPEVVSDAGALQILDGRNGIGQVLTETARTIAVERARAYGIGMVGVRNSNHFGTAMYYTRRAALDGCASILTTNASPAMAPWGGKEKRLGTNPWSIGAPAPTAGGAVVVDIANTAVARGKIYLARNRGQSIPDTWAMDAEGRTTTDASAAIDGVILPMAGHKGYAITFMMDILSGALTGSRTGTAIKGPYVADQPSGAGHMFIAIDVASAGQTDQYLHAVQGLIDEVHSTPLAEGNDRIFYPGEVEDEAAARNLADGGVVLAEQTIEDLRKLSDETNTALPF